MVSTPGPKDARFDEMRAALEGAPATTDRDALQVEQAMRWRLVLGRFADEHLGLGQAAEDAGALADPDLAALLTEARQLDTPLSYIYDREHTERAHRQASPDGTGLTVPLWLNRVRSLFPAEAVQVMERDALTRYGLHELVTDASVLRQVEPSYDLVKAILQFKHLMKPDVIAAARAVVDEVLRQLVARFEDECRPALHGPVSPHRRAPVRTFRNTDWHRTIRRNLRRYDTERERLVADRISFRHHQRNRSPWRIVIAVDQSGSMTDSLIHAAVMAGIFSRLPAVDVRLVLWDHRVVDLSHLAGDPLEVLMSCQLGGGTLLLPALQYCAGLVTEPQRTLLAVISDWYLLDQHAECLALAQEIHESGVRGVGLCALDTDCRPVFDERFARELAACGWFVAALTPRKLAEHLAGIIA